VAAPRTGARSAWRTSRWGRRGSSCPMRSIGGSPTCRMSARGKGCSRRRGPESIRSRAETPCATRSSRPGCRNAPGVTRCVIPSRRACRRRARFAARSRSCWGTGTCARHVVRRATAAVSHAGRARRDVRALRRLPRIVPTTDPFGRPIRRERGARHGRRFWRCPSPA